MAIKSHKVIKGSFGETIRAVSESIKTWTQCIGAFPVRVMARGQPWFESKKEVPRDGWQALLHDTVSLHVPDQLQSSRGVGIQLTCGQKRAAQWTVDEQCAASDDRRGEAVDRS